MRSAKSWTISKQLLRFMSRSTTSAAFIKPCVSPPRWKPGLLTIRGQSRSCYRLKDAMMFLYQQETPMMTPARRWDYSVILDCERPGKRCRIFLPRQIRSGTPVYQHYQPKDGWPATFLCLQHGIPSVRQGTDVRRDNCRPDPREPVPPLWRIVCECAHENCGEIGRAHV